jgi:integrase
VSKIVNFWTDANISKLPPAAGKEGKDHVVWHPEKPRFGVRFPQGVRGTSYVLQWTIGGKEGKRKICKVGAMPLKEAMLIADQDAITLHRDKLNPTIERKKLEVLHNDTFEAFVDRFLADQRRRGTSESWIERQTEYLQGRQLKNGSWREAEFVDLHKMPVKMIDRSIVAAQLNKLLDRYEDGGEIAMTRARATLSKFFNWLIAEGKVELNPVQFTKKFESEAGDRVLTPAEIGIIWNAVDETTQFGRVLRLLMLTAARKTQIGGLRKSELKLEEKKIVLPGKLSRRDKRRLRSEGKDASDRAGGSKNGQMFEIPLSSEALRILDLGIRKDGEYVFGEEGAAGFASWWGVQRLQKRCEKLGITAPWSLHDFRRTFATLVQDELDVLPHVADAAINHKPQHKQGVAGRYDYAKVWAKRVDAMERWSAFVLSCANGPTRPRLSLVHDADAA